MAEGPDPHQDGPPAQRGTLEEGLEKLHGQITCDVCKSPYRDPKVLPCLHYYCRECIAQLVLGKVVLMQGGNPDYVQCPKCQKAYTVQSCDPKRLPTAHFVNEMLDVYSFMRKAEGADSQGSVQLPCEMCDDGKKAVAFCRHCGKFQCDFCAFEVHRRWRKQFEGHVVVRLEELTRGDVPIKKAAPLRCSEHGGKCKLYCNECTQLICRDCTIIDHSGHVVEFVKKAAPKSKKMLEEHLVSVKQIQEEVSTGARNIEEVKCAISQQGIDMTTKIRNSFDTLIHTLQKRKEELIVSTQEMIDEKVEHLESQEKNFAIVASDLQEVVDFVERNLKNASDEELMSLQKQMIDRVEEMTNKYKYIDVQPATTANISLKPPLAEKLKELCEDTMVYQTQAIPSRSTIEGPGIQTAEVQQQTMFTVCTIDAKGELVKKKQDVVARLKSLVDGKVLQPRIVDNNDGSYTVSYAPRIRGRHELTVSVNNEPLKGSPFTVMVKHPPEQLGQPVKVLPGLSEPHAVAVTKTHFLVTEWGAGKLTFFDRDIEAGAGNASSIEQIDDFMLKNPTGIATDGEGFIFLADAGECVIAKFTATGSLIKKVGEKGSRAEQFNLPGGIRVFEDQLYICDRGNHRVQIFTTNLEYHFHFGRKGDRHGLFDWPVAAAFDKAGDLYVTDCNNNRIQVFNKDGHFQRCFGKKGTAPGMLYRPAFIEIDSYDYVYVTEEQNHRVSVFQTKGTYITCFGGKGTDPGKLDFPKGIFADEDGLIYVCDHGNLRIQVF